MSFLQPGLTHHPVQVVVALLHWLAPLVMAGSRHRLAALDLKARYFPPEFFFSGKGSPVPVGCRHPDQTEQGALPSLGVTDSVVSRSSASGSEILGSGAGASVFWGLVVVGCSSS